LFSSTYLMRTWTSRAPVGSRNSYAPGTGPGTHDPVIPAWVEIKLRHREYGPYLSQHVPELPPVLIHTWQEEVLVVLAHEFRHIEQMWGRCIPHTATTSHGMEIDAEQFAIQVLTDWRRKSLRFPRIRYELTP
jgi:hypothetical protein